MLNQIILVGRIQSLGKESVRMSVSRSFKNENGKYVSDIIKVKIMGAIGSNVREHCHRGDLIGIKGRIESLEGKMELVAEKVTFLSSREK